MKYSEVQELYERELISATQRDSIIEAYHLKNQRHSFIVVISWFGGILMAAGVILLISTNWDRIPGLVKIGAGAALMLFFHYAALWLKANKPIHTKTAEVLHFAGSVMFLANIALIGQVYHLSSNPGNAFAIWLCGIAALPWILNSRAQWILVLAGIGVWFGVELNDPASYIHVNFPFHQVVFYSLLGLVYFGIGGLIGRTSFTAFGRDASNFGLLLFNIFAVPFTWGIENSSAVGNFTELTIYLILASVGCVLLLLRLRAETDLSAQWRAVWGTVLVVPVLAMSMLFLQIDSSEGREATKWLMLLALAVLSLVETKIGSERGVAFEINLGIALLGINIFTAYILLIGSMAQTGLMFIVSGGFLLVLGIYLEKKRRVLISNVHPNAETI